MSLPEFMAALATADPEAWCNPPGLGRGWKVKHIRSGLARRVLVEYDGIIAFARNPKHCCCQNCARMRNAECEHCNCSTCVWEHEKEGRGSARVTRAQVGVLLAKLRTFQVGRKAIVSLDD